MAHYFRYVTIEFISISGIFITNFSVMIYHSLIMYFSIIYLI